MNNDIETIMILNTLDIDSIYSSLSAVFGLDRSYIENYISSNYWEIVENHYDEYTIESMDISELLDIGNIKFIDSIIMHHITPRPSEDSIWNEGICTLPRALTTTTTLSTHLRKHGFTFNFRDNIVSISKDNELIDITKLKTSNLFMRFGGKYSFNDFNVNGYLFVDKFDYQSICGWFLCPEILQSLSQALDDDSIAQSYATSCRAYYVSFEVPIEQIDITGFNANISLCRKNDIIIKYAINALAHDKVKKNYFYTMNNPIIMLKRDYNVPSCDVRKVWCFDTSKFPKIIPIDK